MLCDPDCAVDRGRATRQCARALRLDVGEQPLAGRLRRRGRLAQHDPAIWPRGTQAWRWFAEQPRFSNPAVLFLYEALRRGAMHVTRRATRPLTTALTACTARAQNPAWGVRDLEEVAGYAAAHGFGAPEPHDMPANNLSVTCCRKRAPASRQRLTKGRSMASAAPVPSPWGAVVRVGVARTRGDCRTRRCISCRPGRV